MDLWDELASLFNWSDATTGWLSALHGLSEWIIRVVMLLVVTRRRRPTSAMAWLGIIFFVPWIGLVLYLLIGATGLPRRRLRRHEQLRKQFDDVRERLEDRGWNRDPAVDGQFSGLVHLADNVSHLPTWGGNDFALIGDHYHAYYDRIIADIDAAQRFVHLFFYIWAADDTAARMNDALARAAARGVRIRLMVDAVGSWKAIRGPLRQLRQRGVDVRVALPVNPFRRRLARIDLRNHRKIVVIDGRVAYTGSQNVVDADYGKGALHWEDLSFRLTGPIVLQLQIVFMEDWYYDTQQALDDPDLFPPIEATGPFKIQAVASRPNVPASDYQYVLLAGMYAARTHLIITTPYFIPDDSVLQALEGATRRGVRVDLVMPDKTDHPLALWARRGYYHWLLEAGVHIHHFRERLLHAKTMTVDGLVAFAGSSNLDIRSLSLNYEINLIFYGREATAPFLAQQQRYLEQSDEIFLHRWMHRPFFQRKFEDIMRLTSPLL